jgi:hypothetical protein
LELHDAGCSSHWKAAAQLYRSPSRGQQWHQIPARLRQLFSLFRADPMPNQFLNLDGVLPKSSALSNKGKTSSLSSQPGATTP